MNEKKEKEQIIPVITKSFKEITCKHERLNYAGTDYDSDGNKCNIQECLDCGEVFMVKRPHP